MLHPVTFTEELAGLRVHFVGQPGLGPTCVLLHGFGAPGTDLVGLEQAIQAPPQTCFVFPEAPLELGPGSRAWWLIDMLEYQAAVLGRRWSDVAQEVPPGLSEARAKVTELLGCLESKYGVNRQKLVLGGFSQGSMLACDVALHTHEPLAGLVIMSGGLIARELWAGRAKTRAGLPVFQSHGRGDPVVPYAGAQMLSELLTQAGLQVDFRSFEGGHGVPELALQGLTRLLATTVN